VTSLQIGLIIAGVLLVIGVIVYNHWQERRIKRQAARSAERNADLRTTRASERLEPTLGTRAAPAAGADGVAAFRPGDGAESTFELPLDVMPAPASKAAEAESATSAALHRSVEPGADTRETLHASTPGLASQRPAAARQSSTPDHEIECLIPLQPAAPVTVGALGTGLQARIGKRLRWFGRADAGRTGSGLRATRPDGLPSSLHACCWPTAMARPRADRSTRSSEWWATLRRSFRRPLHRPTLRANWRARSRSIGSVPNWMYRSA
jgi:hypothetical protein